MDKKDAQHESRRRKLPTKPHTGQATDSLMLVLLKASDPMMKQ